MSLELHRLLEDGSPSPEKIDRFLEENDFPLVEGPAVTFVYRGEADRVLLQHFIYGLPTSQPFQRVDGTDLWHLGVDIPPESNVQYKINVIHDDQQHWILDPLNPNRALDPYGANSVLRSEGATRADWTFPDPEARPGEIVRLEIDSKALRDRRPVGVYLPARFRRHRRYPLLVVHDGSDYLRFSSLKTVLDNLIHRGEVAPMIVALTDAADRLEEYADHPGHARFLVEELVPELEKKYPVRKNPAYRGLMGASFGGVATLSAAWRHQRFFGKLLLQSGSFAFTDIGENPRGPVFEPVVRFMNEFRQDPGRPSDDVFVSCGTFETMIYENRSLIPVLQRTGMRVRFVEARDGHNWENWRDRLREGLSWLFPGPLWMVYE